MRCLFVSINGYKALVEQVFDHEPTRAVCYKYKAIVFSEFGFQPGLQVIGSLGNTASFPEFGRIRE